ncbi:MAG: xanthine dehydrogenase family protein molybdopterin-binding subunit [Myxococcales bacterium]|nr:xanthine dehydrogenase family protein molybdopterin-binding subunit [Myxococcales bacterium]
MADAGYIGQPVRRPDAGDKVSGRTYYIHDLERPGMLHGKIKWSAHAHARVKHVDTSRARALPGVRAVVTAYDTPEIRIGFLRDNFALKRDKVRQFRDEVAAVAAIDPDIAARAVELIDVEYEPLPGVFSPEEAMAPGAPLVHERDAAGQALASNAVPVRYGHLTGDLAEGRRRSRFVAEGSYSTQLVQQACLGTAGCIAELDTSGNLTIWAKTQIPFLAQRDYLRALEALGLGGRNVRVIVPALGGAFGTGLDTHAYEYIAILLAHRAGRPVKMLFSREEEFAFLSPRQSARFRITQGCDERGLLVFRDMHVVQDNGAYTSWGATYPTVMMVPATSLYRVPHVRFAAELYYTNNTYCQAMRGYGGPEATWAIESNLDELARAAGLDPLEMRRLNANVSNETTPMGLRVTTCAMRECLDKAAARIGWTERRASATQGSAEPAAGGTWRRGVGMAALMHVGGSGRIYRSDGGGVILKLDDYGNVNVTTGGVEMGQGHHTALTQAVSDALGVRPERVHVNPTDTGTSPWDVGTHASRGAFIACNAAIRAAANVRQKLFALAAEVYPGEVKKNLEALKKKRPAEPVPEVDLAALARPERFELRDGILFVRDLPDAAHLRVELGRLLRAIHFRGVRGTVVVGEAFYEPPTDLPDWDKGLGNLSATYTTGAQAVELEVDEETGQVRILKLVAVHDVGRVLNPQTLAGQMYGALAQGVGYALYEEVHSEAGRITNPSFRDYKITTAGEMGFPIELELVETNDEAGPFGAKGAGEPGLIPTAAAIANAIYDAVGVRLRDLPLTAERIALAIARARRAEGEDSGNERT